MLFYCQMRWVHEGRITLDELWDIEEEETRHAEETVNSGFCLGIWKVAGQKRVIAVVDAPSAEELDRSVYRLPMREYLEFEKIWALRDYIGFAKDVERRYREDDEPVPVPVAGPPAREPITETVPEISLQPVRTTV